MFNITTQIFKTSLVISVFLISLLSFSQKEKVKSFRLSWIMEKEVNVSNGIKFTCPIVESNFLDSNGIPSFTANFSISKSVNKVSHSIRNIVYEKIDKQYLNSISIDKIPLMLQSSLNISKSRKNQGLTFFMTPLIRKGSEVKKVVSFDLVYKTSSLMSRSLSSKTSSVQESVLSSGTWYKFAIDKTGVFKIDYQFLESLGVSLDGLNPKNIRIYGNGGHMLPELNSDFRYNNIQENSITVIGEEDSVFDENDYILFYGQGPDYWKTDSEDEIYHVKNIYSDESYYFLNVDIGHGKRISQIDGIDSDAIAAEITTFKDYMFIEDELINIVGAGRKWFGDSYLEDRDRSYSFNFDPIDITKDLKINFTAVSTSSSTSQMRIDVNGDDFNMDFRAISGPTKFDYSSEFIQVPSASLSSSSVTVNTQYKPMSNPGANAYLDYIEVIGDKLLKAKGTQFGFRNFASTQSSEVLEYIIDGKVNIDVVWDVTDPINAKLVEDENSEDASSFKFRANSSNTGVLYQYHVLNNSDYYTPIVLNEGVAISNQNLHALKDVQYVIITRDNLIAEAQRLANHHINNSGLTTEVVSLDQIYNEFASGSPDITAIRDFVKYLYDNASSEDKKVKYLCAFGDSSYDYKNRLPGNNNIVPAYESNESYDLISSYVTDDYYGMMDANEGNMNSSDKQDVATGRILVSNEEQAKIVVDKILKYYDSNSFGSWHNSVTFLADDLDNLSESVFQQDLEDIALGLATSNAQYNVKKIYSDSYVKQETAGGIRYPDVNKAIANQLEKGTLFFNYFGHGGEGGFASERIVSISDIKSWLNFDKSPLFVTITCDFTRFDNPAKFTAGEEVIVSAKGGSASLISTTREVYIYFGRAFNKVLTPSLLSLDSGSKSISEVLMETKNQLNSSKQRFFIFYLGDPAMKLAKPQPSVVITNINDKEVSSSDANERDGLSALSKIKIKGEIQDASGNRLETIEGNLNTTIYDKPTEKQTLDNKSFGSVLNYKVQESVVFSGITTVTDGVFEFEFIVPKDINLSLGKGKISFYFSNQEISKGGFDLDTNIGGLNENAPMDIQGPSLALFMDDKSFSDGGNVSAIPKLIAEFSDVSGINTSKSSIGHSITAVLDGNTTNTIQLNDFYTPFSGDYTKGSLEYSIKGLSSGSHSLEFKVWDTYNNVTKSTLNFNVTSEFDVTLENVLNYPNPFVNYTEFWFTHNQPNELLDINVYVYAFSGKLVKSIEVQNTTTGTLERSISWDGRDNNGDHLEKGLYFYKIQVTNVNTGASVEKFEKLVLL